MTERKQHKPEFKARVALEALKGKQRNLNWRAGSAFIHNGVENSCDSFDPTNGWRYC